MIIQLYITIYLTNLYNKLNQNKVMTRLQLGSQFSDLFSFSIWFIKKIINCSYYCFQQFCRQNNKSIITFCSQNNIPRYYNQTLFLNNKIGIHYIKYFAQTKNTFKLASSAVLKKFANMKLEAGIVNQPFSLPLIIILEEVSNLIYNVSVF